MWSIWLQVLKFAWAKTLSLRKWNPLSYVRSAVIGNCKRHPQGGIAGGIGIKVDIMVSACCESNPGGSIADPSFQKRPVFDEL
jgi:hypothetical protein